jgi:hypothetical protein
MLEDTVTEAPTRLEAEHVDEEYLAELRCRYSERVESAKPLSMPYKEGKTDDEAASVVAAVEEIELRSDTDSSVEATMNFYFPSDEVYSKSC